MSIENFEGFTEEAFENDYVERNEAIEQLWEKQQKSTFTAWCNSHLRKVNVTINAIEEDFRDGLNLMKLLEVISGESLPKPDRGKMKVHKIANVNKCLQFIQEKGVKLVLVGAEEIVDGNVKMTLGMIWTVILRFAIQDIKIDDMSAKEGLLLWCQRKTSPYRNVRVNNFHMSFKDGLALCALIHRHRPELIDYKSLTKENAAHNLNTAFDVAEKHLDIPRMLNVEDMVNSIKPDELSVMAYVSSYYHAFAGAHKAETASNRICKAITTNRDNENLINTYDNLASDLVNWIKSKINYLKNKNECYNVQEMQRLCDSFRKYRRDDKPPRLEEKGKLESDYNTLQTRLRLSNRPAFVPKDGALISDINNNWKDLERHEKDYEDWLMSEMKRIEQLDHLVKNFHLRCNTHESWSKGKVEMLKSDGYKKANLSELRALIKKREAFDFDFVAHSSRIKRIKDIADELQILNYQDMASINSRLNLINNDWDLMMILNKQRKSDLDKYHSLLEEIDQLQLEFAKQIAPFFNWIEQAKEDLQDSHILHSIDDVQQLIERQDEFKKHLEQAKTKFVTLCENDSKIKQMVSDNDLCKVNENPYTMLNQEFISNEWSSLLKLLPYRDEFLQSELVKQKKNEQLRENFRSLANKLGPWIEDKQNFVNNLSSPDNDLSLETHKSQLDMLEIEISEYRTLAANVDKCSQELQQNMIFEIPNCRYTMEILRVSWEQLQSSKRRAKSEIENQILTRDSKGISQSQMDDFRRCFNHFDKNKTRTLEPNEFKACLVSLGCNLKDDKGEADFAKIMTEVDPNGSGVVTFGAFIDYMSKETAEQDTLQQILQSFKILSQDRDYITVDELRRELPPSEAEYCIANMVPYSDGEEGALDYKLFASSLYGHSDL